MGKKKGGFKEPDVVVPEGDAKIGKGIFEDNCSVCHAIDVYIGRFRVMVRAQLLLLWAGSSAGRRVRLPSAIARP